MAILSYALCKLLYSRYAFLCLYCGIVVQFTLRNWINHPWQPLFLFFPLIQRHNYPQCDQVAFITSRLMKTLLCLLVWKFLPLEQITLPEKHNVIEPGSKVLLFFSLGNSSTPISSALYMDLWILAKGKVAPYIKSIQSIYILLKKIDLILQGISI